jgi:hypothetical protein
LCVYIKGFLDVKSVVMVRFSPQDEAASHAHRA